MGLWDDHRGKIPSTRGFFQPCPARIPAGMGFTLSHDGKPWSSMGVFHCRGVVCPWRRAGIPWLVRLCSRHVIKRHFHSADLPWRMGFTLNQMRNATLSPARSHPSARIGRIHDSGTGQATAERSIHGAAFYVNRPVLGRAMLARDQTFSVRDREATDGHSRLVSGTCQPVRARWRKTPFSPPGRNLVSRLLPSKTNGEEGRPPVSESLSFCRSHCGRVIHRRLAENAVNEKTFRSAR